MASTTAPEKITGPDGKIYTVDKDFKVGGIILSAGGNTAFRMSAAVLSRESSVFGDMFADRAESNEVVLIPNATSTALKSFLSILVGRDIHDSFASAFDLCLTYGCISAAQKWVSGKTQDVPIEYLPEFFLMASDLNDVAIAVKLLAQAHIAELDGFDSLRPFGGRNWGYNYASRIRSDWAWALTKAMAEMTDKSLSYEETEFWDQMITRFIRNLLLNDVEARDS